MIRDFVKQKLGNQSGFTLIEMLVVVIILGILAMIIVPQITVSTEDARRTTLQQNLGIMRNAIETYAAQHRNRYPGVYSETDGTTLTTTDAEAKTAMLAQMTQFTNLNGQVQATKDTTFKYGPYIKTSTLPNNPYNDSTDVLVDFDQNDITVARAPAGAGEGWQYFAPIGVFFANDSAANAAL